MKCRVSFKASLNQLGSLSNYKCHRIYNESCVSGIKLYYTTDAKIFFLRRTKNIFVPWQKLLEV